MSSRPSTRRLIGENHPANGMYAPRDTTRWATANYPLGAHYDGSDVTFAVYSSSATRVLLEIYDQATGVDARHDYWLAENPDDQIWRAKIANLPAGTYYAFRCWGPNWEYDAGWQRANSSAGFTADVDEQGHRFNPNKVLFDPYARELSHDGRSLAMLAAGENPGMYGTGAGDYQSVVRRNYDTGKWVPKGIVLAPDHSPTGPRPYLPPQDAIIYEAHVRGLTQHPSSVRLQSLLNNVPGFEQIAGVPEQYRGTYAGAAYMAKYLKALGYTTIELLPVHETDNEANPNDRAEGNYWGYMTLGYFAPDRRYAHDKSPGGPTREFKRMVKAFHDEGLEIYLDVVFNHTGEGGNWGEHEVTGFISFGGFDTPAYYQLDTNNDLEDGATGCGNQLNFSNEVTQQLVLDSLSYWLEEMGVDGFRFDLAPVLGRTPNAFQRDFWHQQRQFFPRHTLLERIRELGEQYRAEVIAEAWDIWGYEVGNFPAGWGEWNGRYRDAVRRFMKGDGNTSDFVQQVNGDYANFNDQGGPQRSIDFIVAHDGFTLLDLVSYNHRNNSSAWPFGPSDGGTNDNESWDSGGDHAFRRQRLRNFWTIQFFSRGVPMTVWGDEFGRTQNGNNNPYNVDSVATWNNYAMIDTNRPNAIPTGGVGVYHDNFGVAPTADDVNPLFRFVTYVTHLRRTHPCLRQRQYGDLLVDSGEDVTYDFRSPDGHSYLGEHDRCVWLRIDGSEVSDQDFLLLINMHSEMVRFAVPPRHGKRWVRLIDTAAWAEGETNAWAVDVGQAIVDHYDVHGFSIVVLLEVD